MSAFIIYLVCSLGLCYAWSDTEASVPFRNFVARIPYLRKVLLCHECSSFWISLALSFFFNPLAEYTGNMSSNILSAFCGFFVNVFFTRRHIIPYKN